MMRGEPGSPFFVSCEGRYLYPLSAFPAGCIFSIADALLQITGLLL